ncbi:MAG: efflux RND transporter periplasmic adaptor subunit [Paracoccus sp. (in: a-proteobacteria)]|nr:efflux RND transporter periplasmic adaptor subunit [Paracoccus sp. (in: a-proteobacteria)]
MTVFARTHPIPSLPVRGLRKLCAAMTVMVALGTGAAQAQMAAADVATEVRVPTVTVAPVTRAEMVGQVSVSGTLVARDEVLIYPQVTGFTIDSLSAQVGDKVKAGDVLATLATRNLTVQVTQAQAEVTRVEAAIRQAQSQINTAQASLTQAEAQLARNQQLKDRGVGTQATLDDAIAAAATARAAFASATDGLAVAQAQRDQAQAQLDLAQLNLDHARITTPVGGLVSARNGQIGAIAASGGEPIFRIIAEGAIDIELEIIESALGAVAIGDPVTLDIASVGTVTGTVSRIAPTVDRINRLAIVTVEVPADPALRPGLFASGTIETARRDSLTVPTTAILDDAGETYVLRVTDGVIDRQVVVAGLIWKKDREVLEGLSEGDQVIARAGAFFADGDVVNTITAKAQTAKGDSE